METKYTSGTWKSYGFTHQRTKTLIGVGITVGRGINREGFEVACAHGHSKEEALANAKLIASAPELLWVAKQYYNFLKSSHLEYEEDFEYKTRVEDIIKKATE